MSSPDGEKRRSLACWVCRRSLVETTVHPEMYGVIGTNVFPKMLFSGLLFTSGACPWTCTFCQTPEFYGKPNGADGTSIGNNWMQRDRTPEPPRVYLPDDWMDPALVNYLDLYRHWEKSLRLVNGGKDEDPPRQGDES